MRHPFLYAMARRSARREVLRRGYRLRDVNDALSEITDAAIDAETVGDFSPSAIGDGKIIDAILEFFRSPQGQALIAALVKMILGLLTGGILSDADGVLPV